MMVLSLLLSFDSIVVHAVYFNVSRNISISPLNINTWSLDEFTCFILRPSSRRSHDCFDHWIDRLHKTFFVISSIGTNPLKDHCRDVYNVEQLNANQNNENTIR
jgi:hypothetical protein